MTVVNSAATSMRIPLGADDRPDASVCAPMSLCWLVLPTRRLGLRASVHTFSSTYMSESRRQTRSVSTRAAKRPRLDYEAAVEPTPLEAGSELVAVSVAVEAKTEELVGAP